MTKLRNMGGYCHTHSYHPIGATHDSASCKYKKKEGHKDAATWSNRLDRSTYWPLVIRVAIEQQGHAGVEGQEQTKLTGTGEYRRERRYEQR